MAADSPAAIQLACSASAEQLAVGCLDLRRLILQPVADELFRKADKLLCRFLLAERLVDPVQQLCWASGAGHYFLCWLLLEHGAAEAFAASRKHLVPSTTLEKNFLALWGNLPHCDPGPTPRLKASSTPPLTAASIAGHHHVVRLLLDRGAFFQHAELDCSLHLAAQTGQHRVARMLLVHPAGFLRPLEMFKCCKGPAGTGLTCYVNALESALVQAVCGGHTEVASLLLDHHPDKAVHRASWLQDRVAAAGHVDVLRMLLDRAGDVDKDGLLLAAAEHGHAAMVTLLLERKADVHANEDQALFAASSEGHTEVVRILLAHGANPCVPDNTALEFAANTGEIDIVRMLLQHGADVHSDGDFALRAACRDGNLALVSLLLEHGASIPQAKALDIAEEMLNHELAELLRQHLRRRLH